MKDQYIEKEAKSGIDDQITGAINDAADVEMDGKPMVTAIQNESGNVYRIVTVYGISAYLSLVNDLADIGLTDLHADNLYPGKYDSLFVFRT